MWHWRVLYSTYTVLIQTACIFKTELVECGVLHFFIYNCKLLSLSFLQWMQLNNWSLWINMLHVPCVNYLFSQFILPAAVFKPSQILQHSSLWSIWDHRAVWTKPLRSEVRHSAQCTVFVCTLAQRFFNISLKVWQTMARHLGAHLEYKGLMN